ncbi:PREDICTED: vacuolar protein sorting-associated protein 51 homolog isoform X3 [Haliaeetus leucocephalus]|uniref:vacuolar protein sorting-associated protein 51 homolog isoform X3 n=1 Tax=Haliaeetus leucocephalus TaxID=52644 RepID=UPI00053CAC20|nr:PREDICTED: vacuolar protein sorting-associated protein 51 homolog isoform X3 [Haliaeetus leucocephalus]
MEAAPDPTDINGPHFDPEVFLTKVRSECPLGQLLAREAALGREIRALDSDMQTLLYENYNKFISATDTIRKMKVDFRRMEAEMDDLAANMAAISTSSARVSAALQDRHRRGAQLAGVQALLRKLQSLVEVPGRLRRWAAPGAEPVRALRCHARARAVLRHYRHLPSFRAIEDESHAIMAELAQRLRTRLRDDTLDPKELTECVEMLLQLEEPPEELCEEFLSHAGARLEAELAALEAELHPADPSGATAATPPPASDILDFVDRGSSAFVGNLCLLTASYRSLFEGRPGAGDGRLEAFAATLTTRYFELLERRLALERGLGDTSLLVRALDRFHRRLRALLELLPAAGAEAGAALVARAARERVDRYLWALQTFFLGCLGDVRQALAAPRPPGKEGPGLPDLLATLASSVLGQLKAVLAYVQLFTAKDVAFASLPYFKGEFCVEAVREGLVVAFVRWLCRTARGFADGPAERGAPAAPPALLLLLARLCLDYEATTISYILTLTDEQFPPQDTGPVVTPGPALCAEARGAAQRLLDHYVQVQGAAVAQMLRKSVETRDWLGTVEPRNVRAVMKRVVEDITAIDVQSLCPCPHIPWLSQICDWPHVPDCPGVTIPSAPMDTHLLSNIQKLFSERVDIFSPVEFNKVSVLTGIIKISLKTLLECVRLRTLGRFGLQQVQVDGHYLQLYLWRFAADERVVQGLLDEVAASAAHRCLDPVPMEHSVVELICERGPPRVALENSLHLSLVKSLVTMDSPDILERWTDRQTLLLEEIRSI